MTSTLLGNPDIRQLLNQTQGLLKGNTAPTVHRTGIRSSTSAAHAVYNYSSTLALGNCQ